MESIKIVRKEIVSSRYYFLR